MLNTTAAEAAVLAILDDQATRLDDPRRSRMDFARDLVAVMADLIRSASLTGTAPVTTAGTAAAQTGTANLTTVRLS
jgi:hypothetical protein